MDDDELLGRAEAALTEIKVSQGLSDRHAAVLAALRIRLKGSDGGSLDELLAAAGDIGPERGTLEDAIEEVGSTQKPSLDDLLSEQRPKRDWPA